MANVIVAVTCKDFNPGANSYADLREKYLQIYLQNIMVMLFCAVLTSINFLLYARHQKRFLMRFCQLTTETDFSNIYLGLMKLKILKSCSDMFKFSKSFHLQLSFTTITAKAKYVLCIFSTVLMRLVAIWKFLVN